MPKTINTQTNRKEIEIIRDGEKAGSVYFSPSDTAILDRLEQVRHKLDTETVKEDGSFEEMLAEARRVDKILRDAVDYAFASPVSDVVFGNTYAFTTSGGVSLLEQFLEGAIEIITKEMEKEANASMERQAKYLDKYKK